MNLTELRVERLRRSLTQRQIAKKLGITEVSYCRKENGIREFSREEVKNIAIELNISIDRVNEIFFDGDIKVNCKFGVEYEKV